MAERSLPLACFGKLPFWPEYLEHGVSYPSSRALKDFLLRGRSAMEYAEEGGVDSGEERGSRFVIALAGSLELLVGFVGPSTDLGGLRRFPFAVFAHLPRRFYGKHYALLPVGLDGVWEILEDTWRGLTELSSDAAFSEMAASTRIPMPRDPGEARAIYQAGLGEGAQRIFESFPGTSPAGLAAGLPDLLRRLKQERQNPAITAELPVSSSLEDAGVDAAAWLELLGRQFWLRRLEPSLFLDAGEGSGSRRLILRFGALDPMDYPLVFGVTGEGEQVLRPAQEHSGSGSPPPLNSLKEFTTWKISF